MKFAYLKIGELEKRISIDEYQEDMLGMIFCADGHQLIAKRGSVISHHFAHKNNCNCICSDNKGEWHISMLDRAKKEVLEIRMYTDDKLVHIADVCIPNDISTDGCKGLVIEYQHSPMDEKTMRLREQFYTSLGYHLLWVFHVPTWEYKIQKRNKDGTIELKYRQGPKYPLSATYKGNVTKILDFDKLQLFVVHDQLGTTITGKLIEMADFDQTYMLEYSTNSDTRPFHHSI